MQRASVQLGTETLSIGGETGSPYGVGSAADRDRTVSELCFVYGAELDSASLAGLARQRFPIPAVRPVNCHGGRVCLVGAQGVATHPIVKHRSEYVTAGCKSAWTVPELAPWLSAFRGVAPLFVGSRQPSAWSTRNPLCGRKTLRLIQSQFPPQSGNTRDLQNLLGPTCRSRSARLPLFGIRKTDPRIRSALGTESPTIVATLAP